MPEAFRLLVDVGNSRLKWGLATSREIEAGEPIQTDLSTLGRELERIWGGLPIPKIMAVSNVAGEDVAACIGQWAQRTWHLSPVWVKSRANGFGVVNGYDRPEQLGIDRWVGLIAARHRHSGPVCVADCGTALTLDVLDGEGVHRGGLIVPGLRLMRHALARRTADLQEQPGASGELWAKNTADAMASGALQAIVAVIERFCRYSAGLGCAPQLLMTGGDAQAISEHLDIPFILVPQLMLEGLSIIAEGDS